MSPADAGGGRPQVMQALGRAVELSREIAALADSGSPELTQRLDEERRTLLASVRAAGPDLLPEERARLDEIQWLNDQAIGSMQHRMRALARDLDTVSAGRRAVRAYARSGGGRHA